MENVPPARLFDEMLKLLLSGHASACLRQLRDVGLHKGLLPLLDVILEQPLGERFVTLALAQTDERVLAERPVSPAFLFAALLWHEVLAAWKARQARGERALPALEGAMDEVLDTQCAKLAITRKLTATMREVWAMQPRFEQRSGSRPYRLLEPPRFRMAYDFLALRAASGEVPAELEAWWRAFQSADAETRKAMLLPETGPRKRRRRRRKKRPRGDADARGGVTARVRRPRLQPRDPRAQVQQAFGELDRHAAYARGAHSSLYRSAPVGYAEQPDFINAVAQLETGLPAERCSPSCRRIEARHGRSAASPTRRARSTSICCCSAMPRIDVPGIDVPHPRMHERAFVLQPLVEIARGSRFPDAARRWHAWHSARPGRGKARLMQLSPSS